MKSAVSTLLMLSLGSLTWAMTPGHAQEQGFLSRLGLDFGLTRTAATPAERLSEELTSCLTLAVGTAHGPSIGFTVDLDEDGKPLHGPELLLSSASDRASTNQLARADTAIRNCLPLYLDEAPLTGARLTLALDQNQITFLEKAPLFEEPTALPPEFEEVALGLDKDGTKDIQTRLELAGFDPGTPDGVIGPRTRAALSGWQEANNLATTGYLSHNTYDLLLESTEEALKEQKKKATRKNRRVTKYVRGSDGCVRYRKSGKIVPHQSFKCDARGLVEF